IQKAKATPMREDEPRLSLDREKALMNAPEKDNEFFIVPRVVEV
ncbi:MAG TPA: aspartyl/glutamyl-tRNA amidotransferase subunit C, partial [Aquificaceae bacterium]|nr:aspartyl/glutamyl-tRNA amidotransferase subunit C [Aquificaceae bacterium]